MLSSSRNFGPGLSTTSYLRLSRDTCSEMRTFITRVDSLGGSDVQVPCVSRVRRSHPRKDITSLTKFLPIDVAKDAKLDNKALGENGSCAASENPEKVLKERSTPGKFQPMRATETLVYVPQMVRSDKFKTGKEQYLDKKTLKEETRKIIIGRLPIMVKSDLCWMKGVEKGNCEFDHGGYFLVKGAEKVLLTCH